MITDKTPVKVCALLNVESKYYWFLFFRSTIDEDRDGDISKEEFIGNALKSSFIADILKEKQARVRRSDMIDNK